tara:strand:+ start:353 stop:469 length:117 start_codon:yes stop_codon:yes gene_type:complete
MSQSIKHIVAKPISGSNTRFPSVLIFRKTNSPTAATVA